MSIPTKTLAKITLCTLLLALPVNITTTEQGPVQLQGLCTIKTAAAAAKPVKKAPAKNKRSLPVSKADGSLTWQTKAKLHQDLTALIGSSGTKVPGLGVIVYKNGKRVYDDFLGSRYIDNEDHLRNLPFTGDSRFRVASVSKQFTALTIMQLVEQKKLTLDEDVSKYLGFTLRNPAYPKTPITARMLLSHTSSLRDGSRYYLPAQTKLKEFFVTDGDYYNEGEHFARYGQAPGNYFDYCNLNYGVLATIIEKITGQRFDIYQREHLLKQLNINGSYNVSDFSATDMQNLGAIYRKDEDDNWKAQVDDYQGQVVKPSAYLPVQAAAKPAGTSKKRFRSTNMASAPAGSVYQPGTNGTIFSPQGGLRLSCNELDHLLQMLLNKGRYKNQQIIKPQSLQEMFKPQWRYDATRPNGNTEGGALEAYGLGEELMPGSGTSRAVADKSIDLVGHVGEAYGLMAGIFMRPNTKDGFLYIMNGVAIPQDAEEAQGRYSGNYRWEEQIFTAILDNVFADLPNA